MIPPQKKRRSNGSKDQENSQKILLYKRPANEPPAMGRSNDYRSNRCSI